MRFLKQFFIIITISLIGEILNRFIPIPVPASVYGLVLMFFALKFKLFPLNAVKETSSFLLDIMPIMFVPPTIAILANIDVLKSHWLQFLIVCIVSTFIVMAVTGLVTQTIIKLQEKEQQQENAK